MNVTITRESTCTDHGSVVTLTGTCDGRPVSVDVEPSCASEIAEAVAAGGQVTAEAEGWQITWLPRGEPDGGR